MLEVSLGNTNPNLESISSRNPTPKSFKISAGSQSPALETPISSPCPAKSTQTSTTLPRTPTSTSNPVITPPSSRKNWRDLLRATKSINKQLQGSSNLFVKPSSYLHTPTRTPKHEPGYYLSRLTNDKGNEDTHNNNNDGGSPISRKEPAYYDYKNKFGTPIKELNLSFASILHNNSPHLHSTLQQQQQQQQQSHATLSQIFAADSCVNSSEQQLVAKPMENCCFICSELLSTIFQSERILNLCCGDSVHFECFKTMFGKEIDELEKTRHIPSTDTHPKTVFAKYCFGSNCNGQFKVEIENKKLNSILRKSNTSLTPKRPAPAQPLLRNEQGQSQGQSQSQSQSQIQGQSQNETRDSVDVGAIGGYSHDVNTQSANFRALRTTLNYPNSQQLISSMKTRRRRSMDSSFLEFGMRSPSPNATISSTFTECYDINDGVLVGTLEAEVINDQLIKFMLEQCPNFNLSRLLQLGKLRVADNLEVAFGNEEEFFSLKFVYLFERYIVIWDQVMKPIFSDINMVEVSTQGSILKLSPIWGPEQKTTSQEVNNIVLVKSNISSITEKWIIMLMDKRLELPKEKITSSINLQIEYPHICQADNSKMLSSLLQSHESEEENNAMLSELSPSETFKQDLNIGGGNSMESLDIAAAEKEEETSDSDIDSDDEIIKNALEVPKSSKNLDLKGLESLISQVDHALS
ncbi:hypothetical protein KGF56_000519 [Candida oxycetoniae]|uniref:Uncharacterized protein n=1 Tax=Candida oxycetoniae TaxID=497107 RepID=A0AAI9T0M8_9ASCO|nr:uncharacterized protein KGF56_000519 [Candida oxycetoniae]KAI3406673.2 hypothetical protein KGF56_000519 [Candida oxycetoniae]